MLHKDVQIKTPPYNTTFKTQKGVRLKVKIANYVIQKSIRYFFKYTILISIIM